MLQPIVDGDRTEAHMGLQSLHDWLRHDGHMPTKKDVADICRTLGEPRARAMKPG